jgi:hypothetical protein
VRWWLLPLQEEQQLLAQAKQKQETVEPANPVQVRLDFSRQQQQQQLCYVSPAAINGSHSRRSLRICSIH